MSHVSNTPTYPAARRRSQRVLMEVGIHVRGQDAQGKDFAEYTKTLAINAHGALVLLGARVVSGGAVHMRHNKTEEEQECRVAYLGPVRGGESEIGLEFTEPRPTFWRVAFPPEDWTPKNPEARTVSSQRNAK